MFFTRHLWPKGALARKHNKQKNDLIIRSIKLLFPELSTILEALIIESFFVLLCYAQSGSLSVTLILCSIELQDLFIFIHLQL